MDKMTISHLVESQETYSWHVYGSGSWSPNTARDFDILCLSDYDKYAHCRTVRVEIEGYTRISNIYYIPKCIFEDDTSYLRFGGYYCYKFALSFRPLGGKCEYDPAVLFWKSQLSLIKSITGECDIDILIRGLHFLILHFNPTFFRSLLRFIHSRDYVRLREWIVENIDIDRIKPRPCPELKENLKSCFYLFWCEYHRHKDEGSFPGPNTISKIDRSLTEIQRAELNGYFDKIPLALTELSGKG